MAKITMGGFEPADSEIFKGGTLIFTNPFGEDGVAGEEAEAEAGPDDRLSVREPSGLTPEQEGIAQATVEKLAKVLAEGGPDHFPEAFAACMEEIGREKADRDDSSKP